MRPVSDAQVPPVRGGGKGTRRQHLSPQHRPARRTDSSRVFGAVRHFEQPVLAYAPSPGIPELIDAIQNYYDKLDMHFDKSEIYVTAGGSEALQIALQCILDDGDEILDFPSRSANYNTMTRTCGCQFADPDLPGGGYRYRAEREDRISSTDTRAPSPIRIGNPTGVVLSHEGDGDARRCRTEA